jgi:hypothetical protein
MEKDTFEAELKASGYNNIETKVLEPKPPNTAHAHDYDIYGLVTDGTFVVWLDNEPPPSKPARSLQSRRVKCMQKKSGKTARAFWSAANSAPLQGD